MAPTSTDALAGQTPPPVQQAPSDASEGFQQGDTPLAGPPFAQQVGSAANDLAEQQTPQQAAKPGAWARTLVGAVQSALSGFGAGGRVPPGAGALYGVGAAARQAQARSDQQRQQATENQQKQQQMGREEAIARATIAHENAATAQEQMLTSQLSQNYREKNIAMGNAALGPYVKAGAGIIQQDLDSDEVQALIQQKKLNPTQQHAFATGQKPVLDANGKPQVDAAGNPMFRPTYTVVGDVPQVELDDATSKLISENTPYKLPTGSKMSGLVYGTLVAQAQAAQTAQEAVNQARRESGLKDDDLTQKEDWVKMLPSWGSALAKTGNDPLKAVKYMQSNPQMRQQFPNVATAVEAHYTPKVLADLQEEADKQTEEAEKKREFNVEHPAEAQGGGRLTTPAMMEQFKALAPEKQAILSRFDGDTQAALLSAGTGEEDINKIFPQRLTKGAPGIDRQTAAGVLEQLFPGFDPSRAPTYAKARADFAPDGTAGKGIMALNAAIPHLASFADSADTKYSTFPGVSGIARKMGNEKAKDYQTDLGALSSELATAYKGGGAPTEAEIKEWRERIDGWSPTEVRNGAKAALTLLQAKRNSFRAQWDTSAVPGTNPPISFESPEAKAAAEKIMGPPASSLPTPPAGQVSVQIPGQPPAFIPQDKLAAFRQKYPNAVVSH